MMEGNYYEILGIPSDARVDRIRKAYLDKVRFVHPDLNPSPDANKEFILLKAAYDVLMDENKRMVYDMKIKQAATTKHNVENFHYDFKSNLSGTPTGQTNSNTKASLIIAIIGALIALAAGGMAFFLSH